MRGYELLSGLLGALREEVPQAEFRECWGAGKAGRLPDKPVVTGQVGRESEDGSAWSVRLDLTVFLPRGASLKTGEELLTDIGDAARSYFPALAEMQREGFGPDVSVGLLAAKCFLNLAGSGGAAGAQSVLIGGVQRAAAGWKITVDPGKLLTAVGEEEPFAQVGGVRYTVEIEGVDTRGLERLAGFTAELGGEVFTRCRWKSLDETGKRAVFTSLNREEGDE